MKRKLNILWTNDNVNTAHLMVFMYAINSISQNWWDEVAIIVWGPTTKLVADDKGIQEKVALAKHQGIRVSACISCAAQFGVVEKLNALDVETIAWGEKLTEIIQSGEHIITI